MKVPSTILDPKSNLVPSNKIPSLSSIKQVAWYDSRYYKVNYELEGILHTKFIPSVTTKLNVIAKPYIAQWRGDITNREADLRMFEAQQRGKRLHAAWYTFSTGGMVVYNPWEHPIFTPDQIAEFHAKYNGNVMILTHQDEMHHLVKLFKWVEIVKPEFLFCEKTVYSLTNFDAGTADTIVRIPGGIYEINGSKPLAITAGNYLLDLKTGATVDDDAYLQTAAYFKCAEEMKLLKLDGTIILHTQAKVRSGIEGLATILHTRPEVEDHYNEYRLVSSLWERRHKNDSPKVFMFPSTLHLDDIKKAA